MLMINDYTLCNQKKRAEDTKSQRAAKGGRENISSERRRRAEREFALSGATYTVKIRPIVFQSFLSFKRRGVWKMRTEITSF